MKTIIQLVNEFQLQNTSKYSNAERVEIIKNFISEHGFDKVAQATGYKHSTLSAINSDKTGTLPISDERVRQAVYVFNNLTSE